MARLTREKDWSKTILGNPEDWQQSLKTLIDVVLNSKFPMFLFWGLELICFYNDAFRPSLCMEGKHPSIHNGIITAKGEQGKGAIFDIYIPAV
jgi:hypothetical protein